MNKLLGDYHTHTTFSHGQGTVLENAENAKKNGLKELGISDHGFGHLLFGMKRKCLKKLREDIKIAEQKTGVKIFLGVEANFASVKGDLDILPSEINNFDIILAGHHRFIKSKFKDKLLLFLPNMIFKSHVSKRQKQRNTNTILCAMDKYPIDILTHLNYDMPVFMEQIADKAIATKTYIEINTNKMCFSKNEIDMMVKKGVKFILDSDAHCPKKVANVKHALEVVKKYNIPQNLIANFGQLPEFKRAKR